MGLVLDSSVLVAAERGRLELAPRLAEHSSEPVVISAVTASELLHGVHRASTLVQKARRELFVEWILREIPVAEFGLTEARMHARLWAELRGRGELIGAHDLLIASTALALGFRLATENLREFERVPDLDVVTWRGVT